jgi:hypothetical protein
MASFCRRIVEGGTQKMGPVSSNRGQGGIIKLRKCAGDVSMLPTKICVFPRDVIRLGAKKLRQCPLEMSMVAATKVVSVKEKRRGWNKRDQCPREVSRV